MTDVAERPTDGVTGHDLRAARRKKGVSLGRLAAQIGRDKGHLSRVERGVDDREITPGLVRDYQRALGVIVAATLNSDNTTGTAATMDYELFESPNKSSESERSRMSALAEEAAGRAASFAAWAETTNVGPMSLQRFETETRRLARDYLSQSPLPIVTQTANLARMAFDLIQGGHQYLSQTRELYVAAGRLSALLSWMSGDLGQPAAAAEHARAAWICADQADHPTLRAWAMSVASKAAFWDCDYMSAAESARAGQQYAATGTALVMLACQEADALKALGRLREAEDAVSRAKAARDRVNLSDEIGGLFSCGPARQANYEIGVHLAAGRPQQAIAAASDADQAYASGDQWAYGTWAQIRFGAALANIMLNNLDAASENLEPVLAMPPDRRLDTLARRANEVVRLLTVPKLERSREALELVDRIGDYCRSRRTVREITQ
jgi:transcriptional regulator with XRE-family HTH domain